MRSRCALLVLLLTSLSAAADDKEPPAEDRFSRFVRSGVVLDAKGTADVVVREGVDYSALEDERLLADIYSPRAARSPRPVVIFIHGGGGLDAPVEPRKWGPYVAWGRLAAAHGFIGVMFNHRLGYPDPKLAEAADDVMQVIAWVRKNAAVINADPKRIALAAYSAGGPLLTLAMDGQLPEVKALVSFYNFLDIRNTLEHPKFVSPEMLAKFSPAAHAEGGKRIPPIFVAKAGSDQIPRLNESIDRFVRAAVEKNVDLTFAIHPTAAHGFDAATDSAVDPRAREILAMAMAFLHERLDAPAELENELLAIEAERREAIAGKNFVKLESIYAADFAGIFGNGRAIDRKFLFEVFRGDDPSLTFTTDELKVRGLGHGAAVVTGRLTARNSGKIVSQQRFSHIYERRAGSWMIVAAEGTPVREPES